MKIQMLLNFILMKKRKMTLKIFLILNKCRKKMKMISRLLLKVHLKMEIQLKELYVSGSNKDGRYGTIPDVPLINHELYAKILWQKRKTGMIPGPSFIPIKHMKKNKERIRLLITYYEKRLTLRNNLILFERPTREDFW